MNSKKERREASKMALGIALHTTRQESGGLTIEDVAKTILSVWHASDVHILIEQLNIQVNSKK